MTVLIPVLAAVSLVTLVCLTPFTSLTRYLLVLDRDDQEFDELLRAALLKQHKVAFTMLVAAGATAGVLLAASIALLIIGTSTSTLDKAVAVLCAIGDSALFGYYLQVWRESGRAVVKMTHGKRHTGKRSNSGERNTR